MSDNPKLYTVEITETGTYTVTVPGHSPEEANAVAKQVLIDRSEDLPTGLHRTKLDHMTTATLAETQPDTIWDVHGAYTVNFSLQVPANNRSEAELHGKRLYAVNAFPFEYAVEGDHVTWRYVNDTKIKTDFAIGDASTK